MDRYTGQMKDSTGGVTIRIATALDAVNITRLLRAAWAETHAVEASRANEAKAVQYVATVLAGDGFVTVADRSGRLVGTFGIVLDQGRWSDDWYLDAAWFYVVPSFRARGVAERLLAEAEAFADRAGHPIRIGLSSTVPEKLYRGFASRSGYRYTGGVYLRMPETLSDVSYGASGQTDTEKNSALA